MDKVLFSFGVYGSNQHPCIWFKEEESKTFNYILTYDIQDAFNTLQNEIKKYLEGGFVVEFVNIEDFKNKGYKDETNNRTGS